jgi:hypothetical protein
MAAEAAVRRPIRFLFAPVIGGLVPKPRDAYTRLPESLRKLSGAGFTEAGAGRMTFSVAAPRLERVVRTPTGP